MNRMLIDVIIPAYNEESSIDLVLKGIPSEVREVIVVDNNSRDTTAEVAKANGATVLVETHQGYGAACLRGIQYLSEKTIKPDIVVFMDADYSDYPEELNKLIQPILENRADMVIGSRALGKREKGSMLPQQIFGNWLATSLIKLIHSAKYSDLGPFRAIRYKELIALQMQDMNYGWTVEMQIKAAKNKLRFAEIPVRYRKRIGVSKITGTLKGTVMAGYKIIKTIFKYW